MSINFNELARHNITLPSSILSFPAILAYYRFGIFFQYRSRKAIDINLAGNYIEMLKKL